MANCLVDVLVWNKKELFAKGLFNAREQFCSVGGKIASYNLHSSL